MIPADRRAFLASMLMLAAGAAARGTSADEDTLAAIRQARSRVRTLVARFRQERTLGLLATSVVSQGELTLVRPDRLRWELFPPDSITYWVSRAGLAYASSSSQGAVDRSAAGPLASVLTDLMTMVAGDPSTLSDRYRIEARRSADQRAVVTMAPTDAKLSKAIRRLEATLAPDLVSPKRIVLEETEQDRVVIDFAAARLNVPVDPARMTPPARRG